MKVKALYTYFGHVCEISGCRCSALGEGSPGNKTWDYSAEWNSRGCQALGPNFLVSWPVLFVSSHLPHPVKY